MPQKSFKSKTPFPTYDFLAKIVALGDTEVGKSSLIQKFTEGTFTLSHLPTLGVDFKLKTIPVGDKRLKLEIWDTAGQERFRNIALDNLKKAHAVVLCYAVNSRQSFMNVGYWMEQIKQSPSKDVSVILVATKKDIDTCQYDFLPLRMVDEAEGRALAARYSIPFFETSAVDGTNIQEVFDTLARNVVEKFEEVPKIEKREIVDPEPVDQCCIFGFWNIFKKNKKKAIVNRSSHSSTVLHNSIRVACKEKGVYQKVQG